MIKLNDSIEFVHYNLLSKALLMSRDRLNHYNYRAFSGPEIDEYYILVDSNWHYSVKLCDGVILWH